MNDKPLGGERHETDAAEIVRQEGALLQTHKARCWRSAQSAPGQQVVKTNVYFAYHCNDYGTESNPTPWRLYHIASTQISVRKFILDVTGSLVCTVTKTRCLQSYGILY